MVRFSNVVLFEIYYINSVHNDLTRESNKCSHWRNWDKSVFGTLKYINRLSKVLMANFLLIDLLINHFDSNLNT